MEDALNAVAWSELEHNYGNAADIPHHLRLCADQDADSAGHALGEVENLLYHQGGWICSAAPAALPFLVELAAGRAVHHRHEIVELIGWLAREAVAVDPGVVDPGWQPALDASRPRLLALLEDPDPLVRRKATLLVADGIRHPEAVQALRSRWEVEQDRVTRWDLVLALGTVCAWMPESMDVRAKLEQLLDDDDLQVRLAAVHALAESKAQAAPPYVDMLVDAVLHDDAELWQQSAWIGGNRATIVTCTGDLLRSDSVAATAYTIGVSRGGETDQRVATMEQAGRLLAEWRTVTRAILPFLAEHLDDPEPEVGYRAAFLLACVGDQNTSYADLLAGLIDDRALRDSRAQVTVGDASIWALARYHDPRCLPGLIERLTGDRLGFDTAASHFGPGTHILSQPGIHEVLIPLRRHAPALIDAVTTRLASNRSGRVLTSNLCAVIEQWGPAGQAALPALAQLLERPDVRTAAARALGGIGAAAADVTRTLISDAEQPEAAWALWRTGADAELGMRSLKRHITRDLQNLRNHHGIRLLADFGPQAADCTDHLRELTRSGDDWIASRRHTHSGASAATRSGPYPSLSTSPDHWPKATAFPSGALRCDISP